MYKKTFVFETERSFFLFNSFAHSFAFIEKNSCQKALFDQTIEKIVYIASMLQEIEPEIYIKRKEDDLKLCQNNQTSIFLLREVFDSCFPPVNFTGLDSTN